MTSTLCYMEPAAAKITASGQVSLPAALRRRWGASVVLVIDKGDYAIVRPVPDDPVSALRGAHAGAGPSVDEARASARRDEAGHEDDRLS